MKTAHHMTAEEFQAHLKHGVMFNDFEKVVECLCGARISYDCAEEAGFDSFERGRKAAVFDAMAGLTLESDT